MCKKLVITFFKTTSNEDHIHASILKNSHKVKLQKNHNKS